MTVRNMITGLLVALGALALLVGFFVLKWLGGGLFGFTGFDLASFAERTRSLVELSGDTAIYSLWLIPIAAVVLLWLGIRILRRPGRDSRLSRLLVLGIVLITLYPFVVTISRLQSLSTGFWIALFGSLLAGLTVIFNR